MATLRSSSHRPELRPVSASSRELSAWRGRVRGHASNLIAEIRFEIAARMSALPVGLQSALDAEPIVLPAWDPMGALAR